MGHRFGKLLTLMLIVVAALVCAPKLAWAATEVEDNGSRANATALKVNETMTGSLSTSSDADYYKVVLDQDGVVTVKFTHEDLDDGNNNYWRIWVCDADGNDVAGGGLSREVKGRGTEYVLPELGLPKGTYYIRIDFRSGYSGWTHSNSTYYLRAGFTATSTYEKEMNDSRATATNVNLNTDYSGALVSGSDVDFYRLTLAQDGVVTMRFTHKDLGDGSNNYWRVWVFDVDGNDVAGGGLGREIKGSGTEYTLPELGLPKGTYYIRIDFRSGYSGWSHSDSTYSVRASFTATSAYEKEMNDSRTEATNINLNTDYYGALTSGSDVDFYKLTLAQDGVVTIKFAHKDLDDGNNNYWRIWVCDADGNDVAGGSVLHYVKGRGTEYTLPELGLPKGTYYIRVDFRSGYSGWSHSDSTYSVKAGFTATSAYEKEMNDSRGEATNVNLNADYFGALTSGSDVDFYKLTLAQDGVVTIKFTHKDLDDGNNNYWRIWVCDADGNDVAGGSVLHNVKGRGAEYTLPELGLPKGTYYIRIDFRSGYSGWTHSDSTYSLKAGFTATSAYEKEMNDSRAEATSISLNADYFGALTSGSDVDFYKLVLSQDGVVTVRFAHKDLDDGNNNYWRIWVCDADGNDVAGGSVLHNVKGRGTEYVLPELGLPKGTYYIRVDFRSGYSGWVYSDTTYSLSVSVPGSVVSISGTTVSVANQAYTGMELKPAVTVVLGGKALSEGTDYAVAYSNNVNAGTASVTVTGMGNYSGTATGQFTISPASISGARVSVEDQTYTGAALYPSVSVSLGGKALVAGVDYTVAYSNNVNVGTAYVTVTGKGNYAGTAEGNFRIKASDVQKTGWQYENGGYYYYEADGSLRRDAWILYGGSYYYLGADGRLVTNGWSPYGGTYYYMGSNGRVLTNGWAAYQGKYYYMGADGRMVRNAWVSYGGKWYYLNGSGNPIMDGWVVYGGKYYYLNASGNPVTNQWVEYNGTWYHLNGSGVVDNSWKVA